MRSALLTAVVCGVLVAGCAARVAEVPARTATPTDAFPEQAYRSASTRGEAVYTVDAATSIVAIEVRRAGSLARLGHDHVVASHDVRGYVWPGGGQADLSVRLDRLAVDEPALRQAAGFDTTPTPEAIEATRHNMLEKTLEAERYPLALIAVRAVDRDAFDPRRLRTSTDVDVSITLHGVQRELRVPVTLERSGSALQITGTVGFAQSAFGITPLAVLGGAIKVQDQVDVRFGIRAVRPDASID